MSEIKVNSVVNSTGDNDSGLDLSTNDQVKVKIANAEDFIFKANTLEVQTGSNIDMNGTELILDADADTSITSDTDDQIDFKCGGVDRVIVGADGSFTSQPASGGTIVFNEASNDVDFRIESNNDENCFFVNGGDDEVCVGATSAGVHKMIVKGATGGNGVLKVQNSSSSGNTTTYLSFMDGSGSASVNSAHFQGFNGANNHYLLGNGTTTFTSDEIAKKNIETTRDGYLEDLAKLRVVKYNWKEDEDGTDKELGLIAQEVEKVFPRLVMLDFDPQIKDKDKKKMIKVSVLPFMLLKGLQEANTKIEALEARITALEKA